MSILHVPVTATNIVDWVRKAASSINLLIGGKQDRSDNLDSLSGLSLTGNANKSVTVKATEDGFELTTVTGGSGIADGDYGDIVVSGSGTAINFDSSVVTAFAKTFLDDVDAATVRTTIGAQASGSYLTASNNLSDVSNAGTARTNLGLGTIATQSAASVSITGGSITGITDLAVADGGTGASTAAAARTNLGADKLLFGITIDGGGSVITTGVKGFVRIPVAHTITKATALSVDASSTSCSITVDVWRDSYANYPPTSADKISASAPVTLSSATKSEDSTLTGWSKTGNAGDVYGFSVASVTSALRVLIEIEATY